MDNLLELHDGIERSKERIKKNGEVFTPAPIVELMCNICPEEDWADPDKIFLDPTCGNGQILCTILKKRLAAGVSKKDAISTLFGIELMQDNVDLCRQRLAQILETDLYNNIIEENIVCSSIFDWDIENWQPRKDKYLFKHKQSSLGGTKKIF